MTEQLNWIEKICVKFIFHSRSGERQRHSVPNECVSQFSFQVTFDHFLGYFF